MKDCQEEGLMEKESEEVNYQYGSWLRASPMRRGGRPNEEVNPSVTRKGKGTEEGQRSTTDDSRSVSSSVNSKEGMGKNQEANNSHDFESLRRKYTVPHRVDKGEIRATNHEATIVRRSINSILDSLQPQALESAKKKHNTPLDTMREEGTKKSIIDQGGSHKQHQSGGEIASVLNEETSQNICNKSRWKRMARNKGDQEASNNQASNNSVSMTEKK